jgi:small subunit ribosomal protein S17
MADEKTPDETETEAAEAAEPEAEAETPEAEAEAQTPEPEVEAAPEPEAEAETAEPEPEAVGAPDEAAVEPAAGPEAASGAEAAPAPKKRKRLPRALRHSHSKPARTPSKQRKAITRTPKTESTPGRRQERRGIVVSDKGDKTIVVEIQTIRIHSKYKKVVRRSSKLHAHDESNSAGIGDVVRVVETRPLSKSKRWRLAEIVEKAK